MSYYNPAIDQKTAFLKIRAKYTMMEEVNKGADLLVYELLFVNIIDTMVRCGRDKSANILAARSTDYTPSSIAE